MLEDAVPGAIGGPLAQPLVRGLPRPVPIGQVTPRHAGPGLPQDRVDHLTVIMPPASPLSGLGQQRLDTGPGSVGEFMSADHQPSLNHTGARSPGQALATRAAQFEWVRWPTRDCRAGL